MSLVSSLMEMRNMIDLILDSSGSPKTGKSSLKLTKSGKPKKVSDRKGKPTPNGDWLKKVKNEHGEELKAFHEASENKRGTAMTFASNYRKAHEQEYATFLASWKESHSDSGSIADTASTEEAEAEETSVQPLTVTVAPPVAAPVTVAPPGPVAVAPPTPGPVKKPIKKAQKAQPYTPVAEPIATNMPEELLPFTMGGATYLRNGYQRPDGNHLWTSGYLWLNKKGAKGAFFGQIQTDGSINQDADEPTA